MNLLRYRFAIIQVKRLSEHPKTADFRRYNQFSDVAYIEAGEQRRATKFGLQVLLSFPSQSSKFWVLLPFADRIARRHSQAIACSMFRHTRTEFVQQFASYPCRHLPNLRKRLCRVIIALYNNNSDMNTWSLYSCVNLELNQS